MSKQYLTGTNGNLDALSLTLSLWERVHFLD
jgi:hypothetical protein